MPTTATEKERERLVPNGGVDEFPPIKKKKKKQQSLEAGEGGEELPLKKKKKKKKKPKNPNDLNQSFASSNASMSASSLSMASSSFLSSSSPAFSETSSVFQDEPTDGPPKPKKKKKKKKPNPNDSFVSTQSATSQTSKKKKKTKEDFNDSFVSAKSAASTNSNKSSRAKLAASPTTNTRISPSRTNSRNHSTKPPPLPAKSWSKQGSQNTRRTKKQAQPTYDDYKSKYEKHVFQDQQCIQGMLVCLALIVIALSGVAGGRIGSWMFGGKNDNDKSNVAPTPAPVVTAPTSPPTNFTFLRGTPPTAAPTVEELVPVIEDILNPPPEDNVTDRPSMAPSMATTGVVEQPQ